MTKQAAVFVQREPWEEAYPATDCFPPPENRPVAYPTTDWNIDKNWDGSPIEYSEDGYERPFDREGSRPIPIDKAQAKRVVEEVVERVEEWLKGQPQDEPLGYEHVDMGYVPPSVRLTDVRGRTKSIWVQVYANPGGAKATAGGAFYGDEIRLNLNGRYSPKQLLGVLSSAKVEFYSILLHEMTHASDVLFKGTFEVQPEDGRNPSDDYYNDPNELRAFMQQIVDDVTSLAWVMKGLKGGLGRKMIQHPPHNWRHEVLTKALSQSPSWKQIEQHLTKANRDKILAVVYRALEPYWEGMGAQASVKGVPPGWKEEKGTAGRSYWTSPDGKVEIADGRGRPGTQRYQVFYLSNGQRQEDIGWPSFQQALDYVQGKLTLRDHPLSKRASGGGVEFAESFFKRHPSLRKHAGIKVKDKASGGGGTHGEARQDGSEIWLFPKFWKLGARERDFVFAHEIGHWVLSDYGLRKAIENASKLGLDLWDSPNLPYGQFNMDEAFADCFAAYHLDRAELKQRYPLWESLVELVSSGRTVTAAYSEDTLEIVAAGMSLLLVQNYIVSNPFFDEKEIRKYLMLRRQFHENFQQACSDLADAFEAGQFGDGVKPAVPALRSIGQLSVKQEQQALRQMVRAFRGLRHLTWRDVESPKVMRLINLARRLGAPTEQYDRSYEEFLQNLVRIPSIPAPMRTLIRKVIKMPTPGKTMFEQTNPGAWFDMPPDRKQNLREVAEKTKAEQDAIWTGPYKDDPEKRLQMYMETANRLQKIQNLAGVHLGIITKAEEEPLDKVLKREAKLESDGPTEYTRLKIEDYILSAGAYRYQRKEGEPVPREIGKLITTLRKAKTFPTMQRIIKDAVDRKIIGTSAVEDLEHILAQAGKNKAIRDGKPLTPLQFEPKTPEQFQVEHDTGEIEFDGSYTEDEQKELLGRVSRAISDLESVYGKGFCGKHAKKLAFRFGGKSGFMAKAHYFTWDDRNQWQPRVTFGEDFEGVLAHELSHYLEDLLAYRMEQQDHPEHIEKRPAWIQGGPGNIFGNTGVPLDRMGADSKYWQSRREEWSKNCPELVEWIDTILASQDYKRWADKLGSAYDTALPTAIKNLTGMSVYDLPKDHPYANALEAKYRSELPPELREETERYYKELMGGDDRKLNYYHSAVEVWARMCEQYVYNKLIDAGISNPWLTWMSYDTDEYMDEKTFDEKLRPIMDRLFARLKGRNLLARVVSRHLANVLS